MSKFSKGHDSSPWGAIVMRILKLKMLSIFFERGEEVFDYHALVHENRFLTFKHFNGVPMIIGDRWSTIFRKNVIFSSLKAFGAPPVAKKIILWGTSRYVHFLHPTKRVCQNITYKLLQKRLECQNS